MLANMDHNARALRALVVAVIDVTNVDLFHFLAAELLHEAFAVRLRRDRM